MILHLFMAICIGFVSAAPSGDLIHNLPGLVFNYNAPQYSGYLNASTGHHMHYWLTTSQSNPSTDPVVLWLNGGPGCSSLTGLLFENGPFHVNHDQQTLFENVYSWNKKANVLYLESPVGVGFSYADNVQYTTGDDATASDNYGALKDFFTNKFPEYQGRPFFITGESYCGVYIPMLAKLVVNGSLTGDFPTNLTGIAIGNGILTEKQQHNSVIDFMYFHGLIGQTIWSQLKTNCCGNTTCPSECNYYQWLVKMNNDWMSDGSTCGNLTYQVSEQLLWRSLNDAYNVYQDCYQSEQIRLDMQSSLRYLTKFVDQAGQINYGSTDHDGGFSCWGTGSRTTWLRRTDVQQALHIPQVALNKMPQAWGGCSRNVSHSYNRTKYEMQPEINYLLDHNLPMLIYNGDVDMVCNFLGDEWFIEDIAATRNMTVIAPRSMWLYRGQIGGYVKRWKNLDLLTVKGAGHFVPTSRAGPALQMLMNFIWTIGNYSKPTGISDTPVPLNNPTVQTSAAMQNSTTQTSTMQTTTTTTGTQSTQNNTTPAASNVQTTTSGAKFVENSKITLAFFTLIISIFIK